MFLPSLSIGSLRRAVLLLSPLETKLAIAPVGVNVLTLILCSTLVVFATLYGICDSGGSSQTLFVLSGRFGKHSSTHSCGIDDQS